jgi:hypothetical protein
MWLMITGYYVVNDPYMDVGQKPDAMVNTKIAGK